MNQNKYLAERESQESQESFLAESSQESIASNSASSISFKENPSSTEEIIAILNPLVREWFFSKFSDFALAQKYAVKEIHDRHNVLVSAPTGSGKTLTAFLSIINELVTLAEHGNLLDQVYCVYISPLKALNNDIFVNLETPLREIEELARSKGKEIAIRVLVRTGDTTSYEKAKMLKKPPHILVTTPESLAIVLSSTKFSEHLKQLWWVVVDEVHALAENKRGVHLSLSLERLQHLSSFTRIGLSATVAPLQTVAQYLVGFDHDPGVDTSQSGSASFISRPCKIINIQFVKEMDLKVVSPVSDLITASHEDRTNALYEMLHDLIQKHKTTLIFTNTRAATERVVHNLKTFYPSSYGGHDAAAAEKIDTEKLDAEKNDAELLDTENLVSENLDTAPLVAAKITAGPIAIERSLDLIGAHHGSLSKDHRLMIEQQLRDGKLRCVVCSTSLELGIDIGYIDLVILLGSPKSVARALQRIGRSGHKLHERSKGRIIVLDRDDLVECALILKEAVEKKIDRLHIPQNCLDVLAQQIFGILIADTWEETALFDLVRKSYCYHTLSRSEFDQIIAYLAGDYVSLRDRYIFAKIWKKDGKLGKRNRLARLLYMTNIGTIPDQTGVLVKIQDLVIGKIDEGFLEQLNPGDTFVLGGSVYQFRFSRGNVAQVGAAEGRLPTVPRWVSEMLPLSFDLACSLQRFRKYMHERLSAGESAATIIAFIHDYLYVDENAARAIYHYFKQQFDFAVIPHERRILLEHYIGDKEKQYIFHTLYGRRVNDVLSRALAYAIARQQKRDVRITVTDNGFVLGCDAPIYPLSAFILIKSDELPQVMGLALDKSQILLRRFRHCASRALMILRNYKGVRKSVGRQQVSARILLSAVRRISNNFPILKEARREVLEDKMDLPNAIAVLKAIENGTIVIEERQTTIPSPFAFNLALQGYSDVLRIEDKIEFVKRLHQMVLAKISLEEGRKMRI